MIIVTKFNLILIWVGFLGLHFAVCVCVCVCVWGGGGGGSKTSPCLKLVRIMLETLNLVLKYKHIFSYLVSENIPLVFRPL